MWEVRRMVEHTVLFSEKASHRPIHEFIHGKEKIYLLIKILKDI